MRGILRAASAVLAGIVAAGCAGGPTVTGRAAPDPRSDLSPFHEQEIAWRACPADEVPEEAADSLRFECAMVKVPLDYSRPDGTTIDIAVNRLPAADRKQRIGSLLTNPGGPGKPGTEFLYNFAADGFTPQLRARYDIIGMDPRGVGKSREVRCQTQQEQAALQQKVGGDFQAFAKALAAACTKRAGDLLPFVGTDNAARDLDVVRAVLGEDKLNFYGVSYGTLLGQFYAEQYPAKTGRMVLDSVVDPTVWPGDTTVESVAFDTSLKVFVQSCLDAGTCPMGTDRDTVIAQIDGLIAKLDTSPVRVSGGDPVTGLDLTQLLMSAMFNEEAWPALARSLGSALKGDTTRLAEVLQPEPGAQADGRGWAAQGGDAVRCLHLRPDQRTAKAVAETDAEVSKAAPVFKEAFVAGRNLCAYWPAASLPNAGRALKAQGAPEILLVQNSFDAATPVQWARSVEGQLVKARLVTNTSGGHGFYTMGSCTKKVVDDYLISGTLPARGTVCHDRAPGITTPSATTPAG
ncbi:alpha/beta hydrolase [Streptomyces subrutilus]|uniref:alpha/beta hydrolase n=1 Tax=Streptomyces subrutilus TaxID=36818 RepID=UPI0033CAF117